MTFTEEQASKLQRAEEVLGYSFSNKQLILSAITHPSATEGRAVKYSYERLEFLGDSILGAIVADVAFERFHELDEGGLTRIKVALVSGASLSDVASGLGFADIIVFGSSETGTGKRGLHSALENVYESLVGAMYLDGGWDVAEEFISRTLKPHLATERAEHPSNPKSFLQECVQGDRFDPPAYKLVDTSGPAHAPTFTAVALVDGIRRGRGTGSSKKEAEAAAALDALERMGYTHNGVILKKKLG